MGNYTLITKITTLLAVIIALTTPFIAADAALKASTLPPAYANMHHACPRATSDCLVNYFKRITDKLCLIAIITVNPLYWKKSRKLQPMPNYKEMKNPPTELTINQILFMQDSASGLFNDLQHDIIDTAEDLKAGKIKVSDLPKIEVWQDDQNRIWTTNHRRLLSLILAGMDKVPVFWANKATVLKNRGEFTTTTGGGKITVWLTDNVAMVLSNNGRCKKRVLH